MRYEIDNKLVNDYNRLEQEEKDNHSLWGNCSLIKKGGFA